MSNPSEIAYYADRMIGHISTLKDQIRRGDGPKFEKRLIVAMWKDLLRDGSRMIEECTGNADMLARSDDSIKDDLDEAFEDAIKAEEQDAEDSRDLWLRGAARADAARSADMAEA